MAISQNGQNSDNMPSSNLEHRSNDRDMQKNLRNYTSRPSDPSNLPYDPDSGDRTSNEKYVLFTNIAPLDPNLPVDPVLPNFPVNSAPWLTGQVNCVSTNAKTGYNQQTTAESRFTEVKGSASPYQTKNTRAYSNSIQPSANTADFVTSHSYMEKYNVPSYYLPVMDDNQRFGDSFPTAIALPSYRDPRSSTTQGTVANRRYTPHSLSRPQLPSPQECRLCQIIADNGTRGNPEGCPFHPMGVPGNSKSPGNQSFPIRSQEPEVVEQQRFDHSSFSMVANRRYNDGLPPSQENRFLQGIDFSKPPYLTGFSKGPERIGQQCETVCSNTTYCHAYGHSAQCTTANQMTGANSTLQHSKSVPGHKSQCPDSSKKDDVFLEDEMGDKCTIGNNSSVASGTNSIPPVMSSSPRTSSIRPPPQVEVSDVPMYRQTDNDNKLDEHFTLQTPSFVTAEAAYDDLLYEAEKGDQEQAKPFKRKSKVQRRMEAVKSGPSFPWARIYIINKNGVVEEFKRGVHTDSYETFNVPNLTCHRQSTDDRPSYNTQLSASEKVKAWLQNYDVKNQTQID